MFAMKAIKSIQSIRGPSDLMKGPILASLLSRGGPPRPAQEELGKISHSGGKMKFAGTDAMAAVQAWLVGNGRKALGKFGNINVKLLWENLHVCAGGMTVTTAAAGYAAVAAAGATTAANSPTAMISESSAVIPLLSFNFSSMVSLPLISLFSKFVWYGQMSNIAGFRGAWACLVQSRQRFRVVQEIKARVAAMIMAQRSRAVVAEIKAIPAAHFTQRFLRCVAAEAARVAAAAAASSSSQKALSATDVQAIQDYSGDGYVEMNESLRKNEFTEQGQGRVVAVVQALAKLPTYKGKAVYRGTDLPGDTHFEVGDEFQDLGFLSTSRSRKRAFDKPYLFVIHKSLTGVDIMKQSVKRSEQEVLFPPGTRFLIKAVKLDKAEDNSWKTIVEMEEIAAKRVMRRAATGAWVGLKIAISARPDYDIFNGRVRVAVSRTLFGEMFAAAVDVCFLQATHP